MKTMLGAQVFSNLVMMLDQLVELFGEDIVGVLRDLFTKLLGKDGRTYLEALKKLTRGELVNPYLGPAIARGTLCATTGRDLWSRVIRFFTGSIDFKFARWGLTADQAPTIATPFTVFPLKKNGRLEEIFDGFALNRLLLAWRSFDQVLTFAKDHFDLLNPNDYRTLFLYQVDEEFFVADVRRDGGAQPRVYVYRLSCGDICSAGRRDRFVVPQQF